MSAFLRGRNAAGYLWHSRAPLPWSQRRIAHATAASPLHADLPPDDPIWTSRSKWLLFSDLHVSEDTLATCLEVLRHVRKTADEHDAGVVFLGAARQADHHLASCTTHS
jgi:hypothetical protein